MVSMSAAPDEPVLVQLAKLDGKLDRITDRVSDVRSNTDRNQIDIGTLKSLTQTLQEGAAASKETAVALALALKDAKETQEATARAEIAKSAQVANESDRSWVPIARLLSVAAIIVTIVIGYYQIRGTR